MNTGEREYDIRLEDKYGSLALIDLPPHARTTAHRDPHGRSRRGRPNR